MYVKLICDGLDLSENELFSSSRKRELAKARQMLYNLCYQRPMTINQIVSLMDNKGYSTTYENVRQGVHIVQNTIDFEKDRDVTSLISKCLEKADQCC